MTGQEIWSQPETFRRWKYTHMYRASQRNGSRIQNPGAFGALTRPGRDKYVLIHLSRRRQWHPTPVLLPGKSHGWSLVGYSPWGRKELDMTERVPFHFSLSCIGEGNGNPLQCSCLEKPRDGGAWWAAIYGITHSWTWLKWLSSSSSS